MAIAGVTGVRIISGRLPPIGQQTEGGPDVGEPALQSTTIATILELSRLVCATLDLDEVFSRILTATRDLSGADSVSIMLLDEGRAQLNIVAALGVDPQRCASIRLRMGEGVAGWAALHSQPLHLTHPHRDSRYVDTQGFQYGVLFAVPLRGRAGVLGVLNLSRFDPAELFGPEAVQMVEIFASHAAIAIENATAALALRYAAARERISGLVLRAPRAVGASAPTIKAILAELGAALEASGCVLLQPSPGGSWSRAVSWPDDAGGPDSAWFPDHPDGEAGAPSVIVAPVGQPGGGPAWLAVRPGRTGHVRLGVERELVHFAAAAVADLLAAERQAAEEQRRRELTETLSQLSAASNAMVGQAAVLEFILDQLARFVPYDSAGVFVPHEGQFARMVAGRGFRFDHQDVVLDTGPGTLPFSLAEGRRAIYIPDVQQLPEWQDVPDADIIRSWIGVPLHVNDEPAGVLTIDKWRPNGFSANDLHVAELFGAHMAVAIRNAQLVEAARERANQLQALHRLSVRLAAIRESRALLEEVARVLHTTFGYYQVNVLAVKGGQIELQACCGVVNDIAQFGEWRAYSATLGLTGWVARHGETVLVNDVRHDGRFVSHHLLSDTRAELVVPITRDGAVHGLINIESNVLGGFNQRDVYVAEALAGQAAVALANIWRYEELEITQRRLVQSERLRALGELSSGVAHDFNNLLASILGHTQLLLDETADPALVEGLQIIERAALDGAATVRRLQSFAQISQVAPEELVSLNTIVEESLAITRPRWRDASQSRGLQLAVERDLAPLPDILGDGAALRELVTNLILNALDAMPAGGTLSLRTALAPERNPLGRPAALLEVSDSGVGMAEEVRARVFEPFFSTKGARGTGMGLAMVYSTVQRHLGSIDVQSVPGAGSRFTVLLPIKPRPEAPAPPPRPLAPNGPGGLTVLVVEDDPAVRRVLAELLSRLGHEVDAVGSGEEALAKLAERAYDLLCSDLGMPGMSGWEVVRQARTLRPALLTMLITGWGDQISAADARRNKVDVVISKPFDVERLRQAIAALVTGGGSARDAGQELQG